MEATTKTRKPILLIRHSERVDEVISSEDYVKYTEKKRSIGRSVVQSCDDDATTSSMSLLEVMYDPTIAYHVRNRLLQQGDSGNDVDDDFQAAMPYPTIYPHYRLDRCLLSCQSDPPITRQGISIAKQAARTAQSMIEKHHHQQQNNRDAPSSSSITSPLQVRIYCSRLQRCIQTAYVIAKAFLPEQVDNTLYVSTGLALTSNAVSMIGVSNFDFLSFEEICELCHDMKVVDCDTGRVYFGKDSVDGNSNEVIRNAIVCSSNWIDAYRDIANHSMEFIDDGYTNVQNNKSDCYKIVVIHRESIRKLIPNQDRLRLPYCSIAYCHFQNTSDGTIDSDVQNKELETRKNPLRGLPLKIQTLYSPNGDSLRKYVDYDPIRPAGNFCRL